MKKSSLLSHTLKKTVLAFSFFGLILFRCKQQGFLLLLTVRNCCREVCRVGTIETMYNLP